MLNIYKSLILKILFAFLFVPTSTFAQINDSIINAPDGQNSISYDDIMEITLESELVVDIIVRKIKNLPNSQTIGVRPDRKRILIIGEVQSLIRGKNGLNQEVQFLFDAPIDSRGKIPKYKKMRFLAFGRHIAGNSGFIRLSRTASMTAYSNRINNMVRNNIREAIAANAPQKIIAINSAFHSPGTIIGEGESQIFLSTEFDQPMAISVISKQGQNRRWSVSTSEVIDINATEPKRFSLLGYRLACSLPRSLDPSIIESDDSRNRDKVKSDYKLVLDSVGPCQRQRTWQ